MKRVLCIFAILAIVKLTFAQDINESGINTNQAPGTIINTPVKPDLTELGTADIIHVIPSPSFSTMDIAFDGENLWVASFGAESIYKVSPTDGTILKTIVGDFIPNGLTFDGNALWVSDRNNKKILQLDTLDGSVLQEFNIKNETAGGLAWDNINLWHSNNQNGGVLLDSIYYISVSTGEVLSSYVPIGPQPTGLAFDGEYLWQSDNFNDVVYKIEVTSYTAIDTIAAPGGTYPNGLAFDGEYLWVSNNDRDSIYQVDISCTSVGLDDVSVESQVLVFPNPSSDGFTFRNLETGIRGDLTLKLYDPKGQLVLQRAFDNNDSVVIGPGESLPGIYFYTITDNRKLIGSGKLIKK